MFACEALRVTSVVSEDASLGLGGERCKSESLGEVRFLSLSRVTLHVAFALREVPFLSLECPWTWIHL